MVKLIMSYKIISSQRQYLTISMLLDIFSQRQIKAEIWPRLIFLKLIKLEYLAEDGRKTDKIDTTNPDFKANFYCDLKYFFDSPDIRHLRLNLPKSLQNIILDKLYSLLTENN
ncbi:MAG: hypothetical protein PHV30_11640 [Candidatus Margulisbacteria bacterium]|nr:hypothetical protein [Candidatus Margulisiibacteriota bacterium]